MIKLRPIGVAISFALLSSPALAAQPGGTAPTAAATPDPARCELHVWGAERFQAVQTSLLSGFGVVGALVDASIQERNNRLNRSRLGEALNTRGQAEALASLDLPAVLGLADYTVITHEEPMDPGIANRNRNRHAASQSRCYAELMVTRVLYQKAPIYGRSLRTSFLFRQFDADGAPRFTFAGRGGNGLDVFPAESEAQVDAANAEIVGVFKANFQEYANNLNRRRQRPGRGS